MGLVREVMDKPRATKEHRSRPPADPTPRDLHSTTGNIDGLVGTPEAWTSEAADGYTQNYDGAGERTLRNRLCSECGKAHDLAENSVVKR